MIFRIVFISFVLVKDFNLFVNYIIEFTVEFITIFNYIDFIIINVIIEVYNIIIVEVIIGDYIIVGIIGGIIVVISDNSILFKYVGFISVGVVVFFYGSNFVFVKKFEIGDGKFEFCLFIFI